MSEWIAYVSYLNVLYVKPRDSQHELEDLVANPLVMIVYGPFEAENEAAAREHAMNKLFPEAK